MRSALAGFWNDALKIEPTPHGFAIALPQTGADGWQLVAELTQVTPGHAELSDAGKTLGGLAAQGQNIEADTIREHVDTILKQSGAERRGLELVRVLSLPIDPADVHVFAEALSAISHLWVLHEPTVRTQNIADITLRRVFSDRKLEAKAGVTLDGKTEKGVRVDYLVQPRRTVAFEILRRRRNLLPVMEQWGYRWQDLRKTRADLMPVMLYDPAMQEVDNASRTIGEEVCTLFCAYNETDRIHEVLDEAGKS
ncbi:hypothetical protein AW736_06405 [Termitidicoccus mucosus]|uniref:DUF1828 domain-containing protein n=1 Tax=Termitidicoccus mucosus TaxID=1184151 RepID=A0A178ILF9_9BACT|nr:hypothetical protein AW736_06405 [Opitutaceae bacterium TSB47]